MTGSVRLEASVVINKSRLRLDYQIFNDSDSAIYAFVLATDGAREAYPHQAYTCLSENRKSLQLLLGATPAPTEISLSFQALPFAVCIQSRARYENYLELNLPIREWHAYDPSDYQDRAEDVSVGHLDFEVTYVDEEHIFFADESGEKGYLQVDGYPIDKLLFSHTLDQPIRVLARPKDFSRFTL